MKYPWLKELAAVLTNNGIDLESSYFDKSIPEVREGWYNGKDGFYFNKSDYTDFNSELISPLFPIKLKDYTIELVNISDSEVDDDRIWKSSISFIVNANVDNSKSERCLNYEN